MNTRLLERAIKNFVLKAEISINRKLDKEFIPNNKEIFCIETSSLCNLKCRFCAYDKKRSPRVSMSNELFMRCVEQAIKLGYKEFHLTPCTGEVFMDKDVFEKFEYMETNSGVRAYHFFTNLTILEEEQIALLMTLKKLNRLTVSIYGHDEESFIALTNSTSKIYRKLISNLETLLAHRSIWPFKINIGFRSTFDVASVESSDLLRLISRYRANGVKVNSSHGIYNNWGGYISQKDVSDLNLHIISSDGIYKSGACVKLFDSFQVTASGIVNGCSCRDVDTTLKIGDISKAPLNNILSKDNPAYQEVIEKQQAGLFQKVCSNCDYYRSIYHQPSNFRKNKTPIQTMEEFFRNLASKY
jgi:sulfatase maturation enzyme AslB (radical SAM superfamily)